MTYNDSINITPNYAKAQSTAYSTVENSSQNKLPLSIKKIIRSYPNLHLQKYSVFAKRRGLTLDEVFLLTNSEEGCLWMRGDGTYIILYNDAIENTGRIRFTLAHELGHFILKHNEKTGKTILPRYSLSDNEYDVFEKEANYFAKRLLAPIPLVDLYTANWHSVTASVIEFAFDTSMTLALYIIDDIKRRVQNSSITREGHPMVNNFIDFINQDTRSKICTTCYTLQSKNHTFCSICGNKSFVESTPKKYPHYFIERKNTLKYSKIATNENGTPLKCPKCENEDLSDKFNYCPICSSYITNKCLGENFENYNGYHPPYHTQLENACDGILDGNFRYCPDCGSQTSYAHQNLLKDWQVEKNEKERNSFPFQ